MKLMRPSLGSTPLALCVTAWIVLLLNTVFWTRTIEAFGDHGMALVAFAIGMSALLAALFVSVTLKYATKPIFILALVSAAAAAWFMNRFGIVIDADMIGNAAQTTPAEAGHLLTPAFVRHMLIYAVLPSLLVAIVRIVHRPFGAKVKHNLALIIPLLLLALIMALWQYPAIASTMRNNRIIIKTLNPVMPVAAAVKFAFRHDRENKIVAMPLDPDAKLGRTAATAGKPVVTIIVAGETARAQNFSLGGYGRKTNPELERRNIVFFRHSTSCGTATAVSLPCMFSLLGRSSYSTEKGLAQENLLDVLVHAGVSVEWWENNTGEKGVARRVSLRNFSVENDPRFCINAECRDEVMIEALGPWLDSIKGNTTLVLHQLGSHGPAYYARYSEQERVFRPDCRTAEFADCTTEEIGNAYDNTIIATDRMLAQIIDLLAARSDRLVSSMIYMSDHGESLGEKGLYLHGMPYLFAPEEQTHVPFVLWVSESYSRLFGVSTACLAAQADDPVSHDNLFHTALGLMDVEAAHYDPALDVTARCRGRQRIRQVSGL
ncbi:MAG: phosphoethanolamine--lipid A transferase [Hoeflea sp.]|uniref:phosphoethanolamine transferase n=1 Tax=Hoeflea sp. TaxID=1940281 RepID=UPI002731E77F|nr:phosphoethanolamine--lipid A transferase [Hoeflea sp.]MDP2122523.1 phosphoethanolamine--lipid A transferase [Hoeflea sp.]